MTFKVTAIRNVTIRAYVRFQEPVDLGGHIAMKPSERREWITLRAGEIRDGLGMVLGVSPEYLPNHQALRNPGEPPVVFLEPQNLPAEHFGLFRLECSQE
jgi:hypothetical protein